MIHFGAKLILCFFFYRLTGQAGQALHETLVLYQNEYSLMCICIMVDMPYAYTCFLGKLHPITSSSFWAKFRCIFDWIQIAGIGIWYISINLLVKANSYKMWSRSQMYQSTIMNLDLKLILTYSDPATPIYFLWIEHFQMRQ